MKQSRMGPVLLRFSEAAWEDEGLGGRWGESGDARWGLAGKRKCLASPSSIPPAFAKASALWAPFGFASLSRINRGEDECAGYRRPFKQ